MQIVTNQQVDFNGAPPCPNELTVYYDETVLSCCDELPDNNDNLVQDFFYSVLRLRINRPSGDADSQWSVAYLNGLITAATPALPLVSQGSFSGGGITASQYWNFQSAIATYSYTYQFGYYEVGSLKYYYFVRSIAKRNFLVPQVPHPQGMVVQQGVGTPNPVNPIGTDPDVLIDPTTYTPSFSSRLYTLPNVLTNPYPIGSGTIYSCMTLLNGVLPNTFVGGLRFTDGNSNGVNFKQGDLVMNMKNYPSQINYVRTNIGELIVITSTNDADKYFREDSLGNLRYRNCD